jgi:hypothetical protein
MAERTLKQIAAAAAIDASECGSDCECLCHDEDTEDPGPHLPTCAWADPIFPDYLREQPKKRARPR